MASMRKTGNAGRRALACRAALVCALALIVVVLDAGLATAEEIDPGAGSDSFELNLAMDVSDVDDPDYRAHPVTLAVKNQHGEAVAGAEVTYEFDAVADEAAAASLGEASSTAAVRSGAAVTDPDGTATLQGVARGCGYVLAVEAEGHERYERVHVCRGADAERWEVVLTKTGDGSGNSGAGDGEDDGSGQAVLPVKPLPVFGGSSVLFRFGALAVTGDKLAPIALALAGLALAASAVVALMRRRSKEGCDAC